MNVFIAADILFSVRSQHKQHKKPPVVHLVVDQLSS